MDVFRLEIAAGAPPAMARQWNKITNNFLDIGGLLPAVFYNVTVQTEKLEVGASAMTSIYVQTPEDSKDGFDIFEAPGGVLEFVWGSMFVSSSSPSWAQVKRQVLNGLS